MIEKDEYSSSGKMQRPSTTEAAVSAKIRPFQARELIHVRPVGASLPPALPITPESAFLDIEAGLYRGTGSVSKVETPTKVKTQKTPTLKANHLAHGVMSSGRT